MNTTITSGDYIMENYQPDDRLAVVIKYRQKEAVVQRIASAERIAAPKFQGWLKHVNVTQDANIYLSVNTLKPESISRTRANVCLVSMSTLTSTAMAPRF
jgi:hypothetical protein